MTIEEIKAYLQSQKRDAEHMAAKYATPRDEAWASYYAGQAKAYQNVLTRIEQDENRPES